MSKRNVEREILTIGQVAAYLQVTRDMIRILANLFKSRGAVVPVLTAADFRLDATQGQTA